MPLVVGDTLLGSYTRRRSSIRHASVLCVELDQLGVHFTLLILTATQ